MKFVLFLIPALLSFHLNAQKMPYKGFPSLVWPKLYNVQYEKATDASGDFDRPLFPDNVKALAGKAITLPGYMVPFENGLKSDHFMLSSLPLNACFFCGVGGPETVIEILSKELVKYNDKPVHVKGILRLNDTDPDKLIYILEQAEVIGEVSF